MFIATLNHPSLQTHQPKAIPSFCCHLPDTSLGKPRSPPQENVLGLLKDLHARVFSDASPWTVQQPGVQPSGHSSQLLKPGGWKPRAQPARSCQPTSFSRSTHNCSTQLSSSIGIRTARYALGHQCCSRDCSHGETFAVPHT